MHSLCFPRTERESSFRTTNRISNNEEEEEENVAAQRERKGSEQRKSNTIRKCVTIESDTALHWIYMDRSCIEIPIQ